MIVRSMTAAAAVAVAVAAAPALAGTVNVDTVIAKSVAKRLGGDANVYRKIFGQNPPAGIRFLGVRLKGALTGTGIKYHLPGNGIPPTPKVGDEVRVRNCTSTAITRDVNFSSTVGTEANWSKTDTLSMGFEQSIEVSASFNTPFGGGGVTSTSTWNVDKTSEVSKGGSKTQTETVAENVSIEAVPNKMYHAQMLLSQQEARNVRFTATFRASGDTEFHFDVASTPASFCMMTHNGRNYVTAEDGNHKAVSGNRTHCKEWERFSFQDGNGRTLSNVKHGDRVFLRTHWGTYLSAQPNGGLEANRGHRKEWELFTVARVGKGSGPLKHGDYFALQGAHGKWVVAENAGGNVVRANRDRRDIWETFRLQRAGGGPQVKTVKLENVLTDVLDRNVTINGTFNGTFTARQTDIRGLDFDISRECAAERKEMAGVASRSIPRPGASERPATAGSEAVQVIKTPPRQLKQAKPLTRGKKLN